MGPAINAGDAGNVIRQLETIMATGNQGNQGKGNQSGGGDTSNRGFASMDPEKQRDIASQGGKAAHEKGTAHEFSSEEAREAGREGGKAAHEKGTAHEFSSEEAREAGRKGGQASGGGNQGGGNKGGGNQGGGR
jgi:general stress protein YciG